MSERCFVGVRFLATIVAASSLGFIGVGVLQLSGLLVRFIAFVDEDHFIAVIRIITASQEDDLLPLVFAHCVEELEDVASASVATT